MPRVSLEECVERRLCALCETTDMPDDLYCYGCKCYVCNTCSINDNIPFGGHDVIEHELSEEDDEEDDEEDV